MPPDVLPVHRGTHDMPDIPSQRSHTFRERLAHYRNGNWLVALRGKLDNRDRERREFYSNLVHSFPHGCAHNSIVPDDTMNQTTAQWHIYCQRKKQQKKNIFFFNFYSLQARPPVNCILNQL